MKRTRMAFLESWLKSSDRKPLVIRGARQVGKTWLVRQLATQSHKRLIELNFEKAPNLMDLFASNDPKQILINLEAEYGQTIIPANCLLFLDEIQAAPELIAKLRWFAEDMPELPVITAGSLLEFVLADHSFSMPVGRISYMHLEPLSFQEFLLANGEEKLSDYLVQWEWNTDFPGILHQKLTRLFKEYIIIGGMPAAISNWTNTHSLGEVNQKHADLLATYRDDFTKYNRRLPIERLDEVMMSVPKFLSEKFVYSHVNSDVHASSVKQAVSLLNKARVTHKVKSTAANGIPLAAEIREKQFKEIFIDVGLSSAALGLNFNKINAISDLILVNKGGIAEQVAGQLLRTIAPAYIEPDLYYWHRDKKGSNAEIDYVIQHYNEIIPIEVKSGSTGSLKSLHLFMKLKKLERGLRINMDIPTQVDVKFKDHEGDTVQYRLFSIPFYFIEQIHRLLN